MFPSSFLSRNFLSSPSSFLSRSCSPSWHPWPVEGRSGRRFTVAFARLRSRSPHSHPSLLPSEFLPLFLLSDFLFLWRFCHKVTVTAPVGAQNRISPFGSSPANSLLLLPLEPAFLLPSEPLPELPCSISCRRHCSFPFHFLSFRFHSCRSFSLSQS